MQFCCSEHIRWARFARQLQRDGNSCRSVIFMLHHHPRDMAIVHIPKANSLDGIDIEKALKQVLTPHNVFVCGKTGVGKSSLINSLTEGDTTLSGRTVNETVINLSGVLVKVWDSPGLQDGTDHEEEYLDEMYQKCKDVDLVLYCMDITVTRWTPPEVKATKLLTEKFGVNFWKKAILVLTKANMVRVPGKYKGKEGIYHKQLYDQFVKGFRDQLIQQSVPQDVAANLRAVAAGYCDPNDENEEERYIYYASDKAKVSKENAQCDFIQELWITCFEVQSAVSRTKFFTMTENCTKPDHDQVLMEQLKASLRDEKNLRERLERENKGIYKREMEVQLAEAQSLPYGRPPTVVPGDEYHHRSMQTHTSARAVKRIVCTLTGATTGALIGSTVHGYGFFGTVVGLVLGGIIGGIVSGL